MINLKQKGLNGKEGMVESFCERRRRFLVQLIDGDKKYVKECNLHKYCSYPAIVEQKIFKKLSQFSDSENLDLEEGLELIKWLEDNREEEITWAEIWLKCQWCTKMFERYHGAPHVWIILDKVIRKMMEICPYEDLSVYLVVLLSVNAPPEENL